MDLVAPIAVLLVAAAVTLGTEASIHAYDLEPFREVGNALLLSGGSEGIVASRLDALGPLRIGDGRAYIKEHRPFEDILTKALNFNEHGGRVRGIGANVTPSSFFKLARGKVQIDKAAYERQQKEFKEAKAMLSDQGDRIKKLEAMVLKLSGREFESEEKGSCSVKPQCLLDIKPEVERHRRLSNEGLEEHDDDDVKFQHHCFHNAGGLHRNRLRRPQVPGRNGGNHSNSFLLWNSTNSSSSPLLPKARCIADVKADIDHTSFLAGTLSLKEENEVHLIRVSPSGSELICDGLFYHPNEIWDLKTCPFDPRIFSTVFTSGEAYGAFVWKIPELYGQSNAPQLEQLVSLDKHSFKIKCVLWWPSGKHDRLISIDEGNLFLWSIDSSNKVAKVSSLKNLLLSLERLMVVLLAKSERGNWIKELKVKRIACWFSIAD
ncbi:hypothetical protein ZIOFF_035883 [Zingiber officinale]|uniref:EIPR1-like beta-propeller domain-containing protein n=1 Tax=Zingiber officinale TaxID=94328 RepID=A0A8J5GP60_ZINOF|nr:hypothetical protein ZIOFF_035883 [Zingiber officinale]